MRLGVYSTLGSLGSRLSGLNSLSGAASLVVGLWVPGMKPQTPPTEVWALGNQNFVDGEP